MNVRLMSDLDLQGKTVVFREDLNVPVKEGKITSDKRIRAAIPSLRFALDKGAGIIVLSHLGRPEEGVYSEELRWLPWPNALRNCSAFRSGLRGLSGRRQRKARRMRPVRERALQQGRKEE